MKKFKKADWTKMCRRLATARDEVTAVRQSQLAGAGPDEAARDPLDAAIWGCWSFAEYAVNVLLELDGQRPEQHHRHVARVRELYARGVLAADYHDLLEKLEQFRLRADYAGYSRSRSVHYSPQNVEACVQQLEALQAEVAAHLRAKGRLE